jgi:acetyl-CoA carboxylase biotin carboxyl carrier protein
MDRYDLSEIDLSEGEQRIRLRRGAHRPASAPAASTSPPPVPVSVPVPQAASPEPEKPVKKLIEIKSQAVGTFYAQREPGAPPFVTVGSRVGPTTVVCIIEAMKVMNEIQAECNGVIQEICVNNKDFVDYNTVLYRVDPAG